MAMKIVHIEWEGPYSYDNLHELKNEKIDRGIYQIYGGHPVYGSSVLLYIGKTQAQTFGARLEQENWKNWNQDADRIEIYVGRLSGPDTPTDEIWESEIDLVEKLLIFAHAPAANASSLNKIPEGCADIHVLNWGKHRDIVPEVSGARWSDYYWPSQHEEAYSHYGKHS